MSKKVLEESRALWNRSRLAAESDELLAQLLDRGQLAEWRTLYGLARRDPGLRSRIKRIIHTVPVAQAHFWLAALASLGEEIDWNAPVPDYFESTTL